MVVSRTYFPPGRTLPRYSVSRSETNTSATSCIETRTLFSWGWTWSAGTSRTCPPPARTSPSSLASSDWPPLKMRLFQQHSHNQLLLFASNPFFSHQQSRAFLYKIKNISGIHDVCRARSLVLRRSGDPWADWTWMSYFGSGDNEMMMTKMMMIMMRRTSMTMMIILMMQEVTITVTMMAVIKLRSFL